MLKSDKRLLFLITELNTGGAEKYLLRLLPNLAKKYHIKLVALQGGDLESEFHKSITNLEVLGLAGFKDIPKSVKHFYRIIKDFKPDLLITVLIHADLFGRILGRLFGIKHIYSNVHNCYYNRKALRYNLTAATSFLVDRFLPVSNAVKEFLHSSWNVPYEKMTILPNIINPDTELKQTHTDNELRSYLDDLQSRNVRIITSLSNLSPHKRVTDLIEAFNLYINSDPDKDDVLLIFNDGKEKRKLKGLIHQYKLQEKVKLMGVTKDVVAVYRYADVISLNSEHEGMSSILQEAMYFQKQIIATDIPENREVLEGYEGALFYKVGDIASLARVLEHQFEDNIEFSFPRRYTLDYTLERFDMLINELDA